MSYGPQHITSQILSDLEEINQNSTSDLEETVNKPLVITGASGFVGTWLTLSWVSARKKLNGKGQLLITSRNPQSLLPLINVIDSRSPVTALSSDIRNLHIPSEFRNGDLIHAATPASAALNSSDPATMLKIIIEGQERVIVEALRMNNKLLFLSSGAVYGRQPLDLSHLPETWEGAPQIGDSNSAYHEGKRVAELMGNIAATKQGLQFVTARLFAFIAPFLPLGTHFAAGNFIRDAVTSNQIEIQSGGGSVRSYLYATDLCSSLWALLARGESMRAYNVGSEHEVTIKDLALEVASCTNKNAGVVIHGVDNTENVNRYVPSVERALKELGVSQVVLLSQAISRTSAWLRETENINER
jgi:nucleoside-diphosphate-sugar epimerase